MDGKKERVADSLTMCLDHGGVESERLKESCQTLGTQNI